MGYIYMSHSNRSKSGHSRTENVKKAVKYKNKMNLSDGEFQEFRRIYEQHITDEPGRAENIEIGVPYTRMSQALGRPLSESVDGLNVSEKDTRVLQDILKLHGDTKQKHNQVVLQSLSYQDCAFEALTGKFNQQTNNPYCSVSPILAALFIPKINLLENHILQASISSIVKQRYLRRPIMTTNEHELFYDLVSDPTDVVCSSSSPMKDLLVRCQLQDSIWNNVLTLRNGRYYDCNSANFAVRVDNCKRNTHDAPDAVYTNDEGTQLSRLLGAFSLRPTICATTPMYNLIGNTQS